VKTFLVLAVIVFFAATVVAAVVFRDARARNTLRFLRNLGWAYVAAIIGMAAFRAYQMYW
jgi:hypothetical protein